MPDCDSRNGGIRLLSNHATGGTAPYKWRWEDAQGNILQEGYPIPNSDEQNIDGISDLGEGIYYLVAIDANGCIGKKMFELISENNIAIYEYTILPVCDASLSNGQIYILAAHNASSTITYTWSNGIVQVDDSFEGITLDELTPGTYCVTITADQSSCELIKCFEVKIPEKLTKIGITATVEATCVNTMNGSLTLNITGGIEPYDISWGNQSSTNSTSLQNLSPGTYCLTIADHCRTEVDTCLTVPVRQSDINITGNVVNSCPGVAFGSINTSTSGENSPYTYQWSTGSNATALTNIASGV
ncbi:MAG: SprB repeat-containing protein, partial [Saprospiraceae bacterium]|nr:SprB repeat-containing protein [Saprospiraceae bacterium]